MTITGSSRGAGLLLVKDTVRRECDDRPLRRDHDTGVLVRLRRGAYANAQRWGSLTPDERYRAHILAVVETRRRMPVVGFDSAAALWGYPRLGTWPGAVHLVVEPGSAARSKNGVRVHREQLAQGDVSELEGVLVTSPERTLVDLARTARFRDAVSSIDRALNENRAAPETIVTKDGLFRALEKAESPRGRKLAARAITFADGRADNPGESESRVAIWELGFPAPILQSRHTNPRGGFYFTDFEWPDLMAIGEFDGRGKYLKEEYLGARTPGEAVYQEKLREDDLRAEGYAFARWGRRELSNPELLRATLLRIGLPLLRRK